MVSWLLVHASLCGKATSTCMGRTTELHNLCCTVAHYIEHEINQIIRYSVCSPYNSTICE